MKILVIGGGGREHTLAWSLSRCPLVTEVIVAPGNPGIMTLGHITNIAGSPSDYLTLAHKYQVDLTIVGPEAPLVDGVVDLFRAENLPIVGPTQAAARLEGSKIFSKRFMEMAHIPTARFRVALSAREASEALNHFPFPVVLKADGLAAGKGVVIAQNREEADRTIQSLFSGDLVGAAGSKVVIEEFLEGEEVSFIALSDGKSVIPLEPSQDHKAIFDGDRGPNTGGMGAYSASSILSDANRAIAMDSVIHPVIDHMAAAGTPFTGFLYAGLMMTSAGPKVLEFNVRLGDPETQCLLHRMEGDFAATLLACAQGRLAGHTIRFRKNPSVCVVLAAHGYPGNVRIGDEIKGIQEAEALGANVFHAGTKLDDQGVLRTAGGRVLGVTHSGATLREAIDNVYRCVTPIHFDGMQYRKDIGHKGLRHEAGAAPAS